MLVVRYFCTQYLRQVRSFQRLFIHISALGYIVVNLLAGKIISPTCVFGRGAFNVYNRALSQRLKESFRYV